MKIRTTYTAPGSWPYAYALCDLVHQSLANTDVLMLRGLLLVRFSVCWQGSEESRLNSHHKKRRRLQEIMIEGGRG